MLTFSNPNYSTSSAEQVSHPENKRSHFWRRFKYDKSQVSFGFCFYYLFGINIMNKNYIESLSVSRAHLN